MYEFEIMHKVTKERIIIWGRNERDAYRRNPDLDINDYKRVACTYID